MNTAESIIQDLYKNRANLPRDLVGYINDEDPVMIKMARNYQEADIEDFEFSFSDMTEGFNFRQKGSVPCDKFKTYVEMMPDVKSAIEDVIQIENNKKIETDYQKEVYESIPTGDEDIDDRAPTEEELEALTYTPDLSEIELGQELMEEYEQELADSTEQIQMNEAMHDSNQVGNHAEEQAEMESEELEETEEEHERLIAEAKVNHSQEEDKQETTPEQDVAYEDEELEEELEEEIDEKSKKENLDEELDEEAERIKKNPNRILDTDDEKETTDKIINQYADRQYTDGMDDIDHTYADGRRCKTENVTPTNPKIFDDDLPGIIVKIDGRRVTRKEFEQFIKEHKEEFVRVYNEKYEEKIREKEERLRKEKESEQTKKEKTEKEKTEKEKTNKEKTKEKQDSRETRSNPTFKDVAKGDYENGKNTIKDVLGQYSDIPWKTTDIKMDNGDEIHVKRKVKEDQQLHPNQAIFMMNGKEVAGRDFGIFARYVDINEQEIRCKLTEALDKQRAELADRAKHAEKTRMDTEIDR